MRKYIDAEGVMRACFDSYAKTGNSAYKKIFELVSQMGEYVDEETRGILYANGHPVCAIVNGKVVEVQEVRHGRWKHISERTHACSICGRNIWIYKENLPFAKYCPHCGAHMIEEETK